MSASQAERRGFESHRPLSKKHCGGNVNIQLFLQGLKAGLHPLEGIPHLAQPRTGYRFTRPYINRPMHFTPCEC